MVRRKGFRAHALPCLQGWCSAQRIRIPNDCRGQSYHNLWVGEGCSRHRNPVQAQARRHKPIFWLVRIRPTFSGIQLPAANPHPTLPLQARGGMSSVTLVCSNQRNAQSRSLAGGYEPPLQWLGGKLPAKHGICPVTELTGPDN